MVINLSDPIRSERIRFGFQPHWRTVFIYKCKACGKEHRILANAFSGKRPVTGVGAIQCGCKHGEVQL